MAKLKGRPTKYTKEISQEIILRMCDGESLNKICKDDHLPSKGAVLLWVFDDREGFSDQYEKAMLIRANSWAEDIIEISDHGCSQAAYDESGAPVIVDGEPVQVVTQTKISHARLQTDNRKWIVSKLLPKFSDKPVSIFGDEDAEITAVMVRRVDGSDSKRDQSAG